MSRASVIGHQRHLRGLACACVDVEELPEHQRLAAGAGATGMGASTATGIRFSAAMGSMLVGIAGGMAGAIAGSSLARDDKAAAAGAFGMFGAIAGGMVGAALFVPSTASTP
jgi:hypothetical protein